jgi:diaminohydroxyphosphoribosylaminopyrimidine deaminase/5-amino-6-(5-phosphoribosylamino)uracil reductase
MAFGFPRFTAPLGTRLIIDATMWQPTAEVPEPPADSDFGSAAAWNTVTLAAQRSEELSRDRRPVSFATDPNGALKETTPADPDALVLWHPDGGWHMARVSDEPRHALIDLYLPICSATSARPITVGHLGQSLDGFIATHAGESRWVTGQENVLHSHRLRALCDAVVVGAGTVAADDPRLTTRLVAGSNPLRVILDPSRRLREDHRVFSDTEAESIYVCDRSRVRPGERRFGRATVAGVAVTSSGGIDIAEVGRLLRARGCTRVFVEGGGVTVSMFLEAGMLDRLHVAIAPLLIGDGRPAIRLSPPAALGDCHRPRYRVFRMGTDVLFDCDLTARRQPSDDKTPEGQPPISRIL